MNTNGYRVKSLKEDDEDSKSRRKRRSKNDPIGRDFKCSVCNKTYLSEPAMNSHKKAKHSDICKDLKRGRGRPRKNPISPLEKAINSQNFGDLFFEKVIRKKEINEEFDIYEQIQLNLKNLYQMYYPTIFSKLASASEHNIGRILNEKEALIKILNNNTNEANLTNEEENRITDPKLSCDIIMSRYLFELKDKVNLQYFQFAFKFIILFREAINLYKPAFLKAEDKLSNENSYFTEENNAESVPDMCNEFITEFMENNQYFGLDQEELIEIIQHFCHWLFQNGYTTSRLALLNN